MVQLFKFLKNYIPFVILIVALLILQAICNLTLPAYTSDILDVGIEQYGIENAAAVELSDDTMSELELFMDDADTDFIMDSYHEEDGIWYLNDDADADKVSDTLELPMVMVSNLSSASEETVQEMVTSAMPEYASVLEDTPIYELGDVLGIDLEVSDNDGEVTVNLMPLVESMYESGMLDKSTLISMGDAVTEQFGDSSELFLSSAAISFVNSEYEKIGVDVNAIQRSYLYSAGGKMILMTVLMSAAAILAGLCASYVAAKNSQDLRGKLFKRVLSFGNTEIDQFSTASLITRSTNDIQQIQMTTMMVLRMVLYAPILAIGGIIRVVRFHTGLGWIIIVAACAITGLIIVLIFVAMPKFRIMQVKIDKVNLISREFLDGIPVIRAFGREKHEEERFDVASKDLMKTQMFTNRVMALMMPCMMFVMNGVNLLIIWFAAKGMDEGLLQVGDMVAFMTYALQIIMAFMMIEMLAIMLPRAGVSANRVQEIIDTEPSIKDKEDADSHEKEKYEGRVEFDHVTFYYPNAPEPALRDITFTAEPGQTTAIIGSTGCGKSTLINLLPRFYDVSEGEIKLDGTDIRDISQKTLRDQIGLAPQKGFLFSGTIESNIKYADDELTDEEMRLAAEISQSTAFIEDEADQYNSTVAQGGTNFSGGQRQRLSIARALAKGAPVLVFDDSFSALDYKTDLALRKALAEEHGESTVIIVAQRIATVLHADKIVVMNDGEVVGIGTHEELMQSCETYQEIARSQLSEQELAANGGVN
ncbi:MAG: ABC transporter ATP-binding protein/permease [Lachnospiraceae bacterium]|nr:ABC transporter ATP-binding protein/permease [Lachnospiraceae bacterium]